MCSASGVSSPGPDTRASAAASSAALPTMRFASGTPSSSAGLRRAGSPLATRFASRPATRSTATTSRRTGRRSKPASAGPARSPRSSPASTCCEGRRSPARPRSSWRSSWTTRESRAAGWPSRAAVRSRRARSRRCWTSGSGSRTSRPTGPSRPRSSRSTSAAGRASRSTSERRASVAAEESYPDDVRYHEEHDWARVDGDVATLGITWYAQDALGEIVHFEAPEEGSSVARDESYGEVESVKAVSDLISPVSGEVVEVNAAVVDEPEKVNDDPYGDGWLVKIRLSDASELGELMDADAYRKLLEDQA